MINDQKMQFNSISHISKCEQQANSYIFWGIGARIDKEPIPILVFINVESK